MFDKAIVITDRMTKKELVEKHTKEEWRRLPSGGMELLVITSYDDMAEEWAEIKNKEIKRKNRNLMIASGVLFALCVFIMLHATLTPTYKQEYINSVKENNDLKRELRKMNAERAKVREIIKGDSLGTLMYW